MGSRWTRLVLVSLILLGLQTTVLNDMRPFGVMIPVMLLFAVTAGTLYGSEIGAISGGFERTVSATRCSGGCVCGCRWNDYCAGASAGLPVDS